MLSDIIKPFPRLVSKTSEASLDERAFFRFLVVFARMGKVGVVRTTQLHRGDKLPVIRLSLGNPFPPCIVDLLSSMLNLPTI